MVMLERATRNRVIVGKPLLLLQYHSETIRMQSKGTPVPGTLGLVGTPKGEMKLKRMGGRLGVINGMQVMMTNTIVPGATFVIYII